MAFDTASICSATASRRVSCLVGPALSGKSHALRSWGERDNVKAIFFAVDEERESLFQFVHGLVTELAHVARGAMVSFNAMQDRLAAVPAPAARVAAWLCSHLPDRSITIVIDNVEVIAREPQIVEFFDHFVQGAENARFILAGRSLGDLPVNAWMAFGIAGLPIHARGDDAKVSADLLYGLSGAERAFLERLSLLGDLTDTVVDTTVGVAGAALLLQIRNAHPAIFEHHKPLRMRRDVRRRLLDGCRGRDAIALRAMVLDVGESLVRNHRYEDALDVYHRTGAYDLLRQLLSRHGLHIAESVSAHAIDSALRALPDGDEDPVIYALKAASASRAGRYDVAENLFTEAAKLASGDLKHQITYAYGCDLLRRNRLDALDVLSPLLADELDERREVEVRSALAQSCVMNERPQEALDHITRVLALVNDVEDEATKALLYTRVGYVYLYSTSDLAQTERYAQKGLDFALQTFSYVVAVGALSVIYAVACRRDEPQAALQALQQLANYSVKIGNIDFQSYAVMAMLEYHVELYDLAAIAEATRMLRTFDVRYETKVTSDALLPSQAMQRAWEGSFERAYDLLLPSLAQQAGDDFRAYREAQLALYAIAAGRSMEARTHLRRVRCALETLDRGSQKVVRAGILAALASSIAGDRHADHHFAELKPCAQSYPRLEAFRNAALHVHLMWTGTKNAHDVEAALRRLESEGGAGLAVLLAQLPMPLMMREHRQGVRAVG